jgi:hypothetical protein
MTLQIVYFMGLVHLSVLKITLYVSRTGSVSHPEVSTLNTYFDGTHSVVHIINQINGNLYLASKTTI